MAETMAASILVERSVMTFRHKSPSRGHLITTLPELGNFCACIRSTIAANFELSSERFTRAFWNVGKERIRNLSNSKETSKANICDERHYPI